MPRYRFDGPYDRVFTDLHAGEDLVALRPDEEAPAGFRVVADVGQVLHLQPGDELLAAEPLAEHVAAHPELVLLLDDDTEDDAAGAPEETSSKPGRRRAAKTTEPAPDAAGAPDA